MSSVNGNTETTKYRSTKKKSDYRKGIDLCDPAIHHSMYDCAFSVDAVGIY